MLFIFQDVTYQSNSENSPSKSDGELVVFTFTLEGALKFLGVDVAVQKEMGSPNYFKFTRELKSAKM